MSKSIVSERKLAANRENSKKSTGPRTAEGKARSRLNAVTHGMTAEMVVLPTEDRAAFEAERRGLIEDWKPESQIRMILVERLAAESWRLRRCVRLETTRLSDIAYHLGDNYDSALNARLNKGLRLLKADPQAGLEALANDPSGIELLIDLWAKIARDATGGWNDIADHYNRYLNLLGIHDEEDPEALDPELLASFNLLCHNQNELPEEKRLDANEATRIADGIALVARRNIAALVRRLDTFIDPAVIRTREIESACIDLSPEGLNLQRYEMAHDRSFRATLAQLVQMVKTGSDLLERNEATDAITDCVPEPSVPKAELESTPKSDPKPANPSQTARTEADTPNEPTEALAPTSNRDRDGRIWAIEATDPGQLNQ